MSPLDLQPSGARSWSISDASLIGLTATPDNRTYGFFRKNVVSEYAHEQAVADGVNVGNEIYAIDTEKTRHGGQLTGGPAGRET